MMWLLLLTQGIAGGAFGAGKCALQQAVEVPITMDSLRPLIDVKINGQPAKFIIDSGAFYSSVSEPIARQCGLSISPGVTHVRGVGGTVSAGLVRVKEFTLLNLPIKNVEFLVGGSEVGYAGLMGQNLLSHFDVEYDLGHGLIRLFHSDGCAKTVLAYWVKPGEAFSTMPIERMAVWNPHTVGNVMLNGQKIRVMFDTGAYTSILSMRAAARAGVKADSPGVTDGGSAGGIGRNRVRSYIGNFSSFKVGDGEEIRNAKLRFAEMDDDLADMLLGADFFISHRIFVNNDDHVLFLTYGGGPVFDLSRHPSASPAGEAQPAADAELLDPAELARRGSALAARGEFAPAINDLSRAVELRPQDPEYYYQRAEAYQRSGQREAALADYDRVLELQHDFLPAYIPRAELKFTQHDEQGASDDLDAVNRLAPKQADLRFRLAHVYLIEGRASAAVEQYGQWIDTHPDDSRLSGARAGRCLARAMQNAELKEALSDCERAMGSVSKTDPAYGGLYAERGLVRFRQGNYDKAMADFVEAVRLTPKDPLGLYGRGLTETHRNLTSQGESDIAEAKKLDAEWVRRLEHAGFVP